MDCNMDAGYEGASGRSERNRITLLKYAFIPDLAGITNNLKSLDVCQKYLFWL